MLHLNLVNRAIPNVLRRTAATIRLTKDEKDILHEHWKACALGRDTYVDPASKYVVISRVGHLRRGVCCGSCCRHCPFNHKNVPTHLKTKRFNGHFYY